MGRRLTAFGAAALFAGALLLPVLGAVPALAPGTAAAAEQSDNIVQVAQIGSEPLPAALKGESEIEQLTSAYKEKCAAVEAADAKIAELQAEIDQLEEILPAQEARSNAGIKERYIMQSNPIAIAEPLLSSQTLDDFFQQIDYLERASRSWLRELNKTKALKAEREALKAEQETVRADAAEQAEQARQELAAAQDERAAKQRKAQENAKFQAEKAGGEKSVGLAADGGEQPEDYREAATQDTEALDDGADWHADRDAFIAEWSERIDRYLAGSPLAGQGVNFAASAWKWNVDPRWSPAISNTESSKGAYCIRAHNAWGWGAADSDPYNLASEWDSWEEAIDAHVAGLAKGYGYTITLRGAMTYCPNTWQSWYNKTLDQMSQI